MTGWLTQTLIATTLLMTAVLMVRETVAKRYGARAAYLLWLAPALRMFMPPLPAAWFGTTIAALPSAAQPGLSWLWIATGLWLMGSLGFLTWHILNYARFSSRLRNSARWLFAERRIEVAQSNEIASPVAFGLLHQTVMLPADFEDRYDVTEQRLALAHEIRHHDRRDLAANLVALIMLALHWFNPVAHIAYRAFRTDQEAACDADTLIGATPAERHSYGIALFKSATSGLPLAACGNAVAVTIKTRLRRIAMLNGQRLSFASKAILSGLMALALVATASHQNVPLNSAAEHRPYPAIAAAQPALPQGALAPASVIPVVARTKEIEVASVAAKVAPSAPEKMTPPNPAATAQSLANPGQLATSAPVNVVEAPHIIEANVVSCVATGPQRLSVVADSGGVDSVQMVQLVTCLPDGGETARQRETAQAALAALRLGRTRFAQDQVIDANYRARALDQIDAEIERLDALLSNAPIFQASLQ